MTDFYGRFSMTWASSSTPVPPSDAQAAQGLSFLGQTPPSAQLHDAMFQWLDQKDTYLFNQISSVFNSIGGTISEASPSALGNLLATFIKGKYNLNTTGSPDNNYRGYQVLPSGLIIQWGTDSTLYSTTSAKGGDGNTFNFAIQFPNECFGVILNEAHAQGWDVSGGTLATTIYGATFVNQTGFGAECMAIAQSSSGLTMYHGANGYFFFIAVGY